MIRIRSLATLSACLMTTLLFSSCANQIPPPGGPVDTTPPSIIATYPEPFTLGFSGHRFDLAFDKYVDHRSAEEAIFVSPYINDLQFNWSGKDVEISFTGDLKKNTTYVINVGTDVRDLRSPPNHMTQSYTLAFSTGDAIDRGALRGRIYPIKPTDPPEGVMIFAYQLAGIAADTLNPRTAKPDYITQTGKNGEFFLQHVALGPYRIMAVRDVYHNLLYDPETDEYGVPPRDFILTENDTLQDGILLQLAREDTTAPRLVRVDPRDVNHVLMEFSEPIDTSTTNASEVAITDTLLGQALKVESIYPEMPSTSKFIAVTNRQDSTRGYVLTVKGMRDRAGIPLNASARSLIFTGSSSADTVQPALSSVSVKDSARSVSLHPAILLGYSDAVQRGTLSNAITLFDNAGRTVPSTIEWPSDACCVVRPLSDLAGKSWYALSILTYGAVDWSGRKFRDSLKVVHFETLDPEILSSIEGQVVDANLAETGGPVFVTARGVDPKNQNSYTVAAEPTGSFTLSGIDEGRYVLRAFRDRNSNGKFDAGLPFRFSGSERFGEANDTLKVRARWPLEGVRIDLR